MKPDKIARMRWKKRPEGSTWGDFGPDDQLGRLNLLTAERVRAAVAEVKEGISFCLSLPLDFPGGNVLNPRRHPPVLRPTFREGQPNMNFALKTLEPKYTDVVCDDAALIHLQYSTQWDSLAHVGSLFDADGDGVPEKVYYNGYRAHEDILGPEDGGGGARRLGIENIAATCVQGRGVMIDLLAHYGEGRTAVGYEQLMRVLDGDLVLVEEGDLVCLRTGFADALLAANRQPDGEKFAKIGAALDGRDDRLLQWITDSGLVALFADNYAVELHPATPCEGETCASLPLHQHCLFKLGVPLGEMWHMGPLADWLRGKKRNRFLLTAPPLRLPGAVGSPATPVATV